MIALDETNIYAAEVPFTMPLAADPLTGLTGYVWTLGEVQIKLPGGAWINVALDHIREVGYGRFAVRLDPAQCTTAGVVAIYATATDCQPFRGSELISTLGGDIAVGGTGYLMAYLPDAIDPVYGTPASGDFDALPGALARVAWQNANYVDVDIADVVEFGFGMYGIPVPVGNTVLRGKAYYYLEADDYQRFESYSMILTATVFVEEVVVDVSPTPIESPTVYGDAAYVDHTQLAYDRLCQYAKFKAPVAS